MTLEQAYEQRVAIEQAGQAIYIKVRPAGIAYRLEFREAQAQQPSTWYRVMLFWETDRIGRIITLPGQASVIIE